MPRPDGHPEPPPPAPQPSAEFDAVPREFNAAVHFIDAHVRVGRGEKTAYIDDKGSYTYRELSDRVDRAGRMLLDAGLPREARVALVMEDGIDFVAVFWGAIKAGLVPVPINTLLTREHYRYILSDCRARVLVVTARLHETLAAALDAQPHLEQVISSGGDVEGMERLDVLMAATGGRLTPAPTIADEIALWLYSSGSTGDPKGVCHMHRSLLHTSRAYGNRVLGIRADDVVFSAAKLFFAYGLGNAMTFPLSVGATTVLTAERPTPALVRSILDRHRPTLFFGVPTLYAAMLADDPDGGPVASALRLCVSAGEALPADTGKRIEARYGVPVLDGVGSTEMLHIFMSNRQDEIRYGTAGRPVPGYAARLVDADGAPVPAGELGELAVSGDSSAAGYWNQADKSRRTFAGAWTYTGDKYVVDADGYYHFCGRSDDMFKSGGNWVSPFDVEAVLMTHPSVLEAAVVAHPDEHDNLKPKAFVVLGSGQPSDALADELKTWVKQHTEVWKYPRWIEFRDALPKTATGKIQRFRLRDG